MYSIIKTCFFLVAVTSICHGQLLYFSNTLKSNREADMKSNRKSKSKVQISTFSDDLIVDTLNALTSLPIALARVFGSEEDILSRSDNNLVDLDYVVTDFEAGMGNEDANLNIQQLLTKYRYPSEKHQVITEDGYVLSLFRIPNNGSVIFLMHGIAGSADDFIMAGPESGLAYLLADAGYDVWMGNARGNKFSRQHNKLKPSQAAFWDFSWHEIGIHDLPAMIDYVLLISGKDTVKYIGHSQGTTTFFVMLSERPEYNKKIDLMIALSPVAFMSNTKSPIVRFLAAGTIPLHALARSTGIYEFFADTKLTRILKRLFCGTGAVAELLCSNPILLFVGFSFEHLNVTNLPVVYGHTPSGSSAKQFAHYGQGVISGDFRQFDYGKIKNTELYGMNKPPSYNLKNVQVPISLYYSDADWLAMPKDVEKLYAKLGNDNKKKEKYRVPSNMFNHMDFLLAKDFKTLIFRKIRKRLGKV